MKRVFVVSLLSFITACQSAKSGGIRFDLSALTRGLEGVGVDRVVFVASCDDGSGRVPLSSESGAENADQLVLDPRDDDTYALRTGTQCASVTFAYVVYRAPTGEETSRVAVAMGSTSVKIDGGEQDVTFRAVRAGDLEVGFGTTASDTQCSLFVTRMGEIEISFGPLEPETARVLPLPTGSYEARCINDAVTLGPQAFTITFAQRTRLALLGEDVPVGPAAALSFGVAPPTGATNGEVWPAFTVKLIDANGNDVADDGVVVTLASSKPGIAGTLTATTVAGVATFDAVSAIEPGILSFDVTAAGLTGILGTEIDIASKPAAAIAFAAPPLAASVDDTQSVLIRVLDADGHTSTDPLVISLGLAPGGPSGATCFGCGEQTANGGSAVFSGVRVDTPGSFTLRASSPPLTDVDAALTITAGAPARLHFLNAPTDPVTADQTLTGFAVEVRDQFDNPVTTSGVSIELVTSLLPGGGGFVNGTATTNANGQAIFASTRATKAGLGQTIIARITSTMIVTDNPFTLSVTHGVTADVRFVSPPTQLGAGTPVPLTIEAIDQAGNRVLTENGTISNLSTGNGGDTITFASELATGAISGSINFFMLGARTLHVELGAFSDDVPVTVVVGPPSQLVMDPIAPNPIAGVANTIHLEVRDGANHIVTDYAGPVTLSTMTDPSFGTPSHTFTASDMGVHDFAVTFSEADVQHNVSADATLPTPFNGTLSVTVDPAAVSALVFSQQPPASVFVNDVFLVRVDAVDAFGNKRTQDDTTIQLEYSGPAGPVLVGGGTQTTVSGEATFASLAIDAAATGVQLRAHVGGLFEQFSNSFDVVAHPVPNVLALCEDIVVPGLRVAVRGSGFATSSVNTSVSIMSATPATLLNYSTTEFSFVVPAGLSGATGDLTITTPGGTTAPLTLTRGPVRAHGGLASFSALTPSLSADGRYVAFVSNTNLDGNANGDSDSDDDIFVTDMVTGVIERMSVNNSGIPGAHGSTGYLAEGPSISGDGCRVAFTAVADNLTSVSFFKQVYVRDRCVNDIYVISSGYNGDGNGDSYNARISADGDFVVFESNATNLVRGDFEATTDIFVADLRPLRTNYRTRIERVNVRSYMGNVTSIGDAHEPAISADGRFVVFVTKSGTVPDPNVCSNGKDQIVWMDRVTYALRIVSRASTATGVCGDGDSAQPAVSADGTKVVFASPAASLDALSDGPLDDDVFLRDMKTLTTTRLSVDGAGAVVNGSSSRPQISADGQYVSFISTSGLLAGGPDSPSNAQAFVRRLASNTSTLVSLDVNGAIATLPILDFVLSHDGARVAMSTLADLSGAPDSAQDVFVSTAGRAECPTPHIFSTEPKNVAQANTAVKVKGYGFDQITGATCSFGGGPNLVVTPNNEYSLSVQTAFPFSGGALSCAAFGAVSPPTVGFDIGPVLASAINDTTASNGPSAQPRLSADGSIVVFESTATDFSGDGQALSADAFVHNRSEPPRSTTLASPRLGPGGPTGALGDVKHVDVSYDGRYVVFESASDDLALDNLSNADTNGVSDVFIYDRALDVVKMVSVGPSGQGNAASRAPRISGDGRIVVWESAATNLDGVVAPTGGFTQIYARDLEQNITRLVTRVNGSGANGHCEEPQIDAFGERVLFVSQAPNLEAAQSYPLIYVADLTPGFFTLPQDASIGIASAASEGSIIPDEPCASPAFSGNGEVFTYITDSTNLGPTGNVGELHVLRQTFGSDPDRITFGAGVPADTKVALDFSGQTLVFASDAPDLVPGDTNGVSDIFAWTQALGVRRISFDAGVSELGTPSTDPAISAFGNVVAYCSDSDLTSSPQVDGNGVSDVWITSVSD